MKNLIITETAFIYARGYELECHDLGRGGGITLSVSHPEYGDHAIELPARVVAALGQWLLRTFEIGLGQVPDGAAADNNPARHGDGRKMKIAAKTLRQLQEICEAKVVGKGQNDDVVNIEISSS